MESKSLFSKLIFKFNYNQELYILLRKEINRKLYLREVEYLPRIPLLFAKERIKRKHSTLLLFC